MNRKVRFLLLFFFYLCAWTFPVEAQEVRRALPSGSAPDEQARFLGGLPVAAESELAPLQAQGFYLEHLQAYGRTWQRFMGEHFDPKRLWAIQEIAALAPTPPVLYYLFSGPDLINAMALFPWTEVFILVALEPLGKVPPPESLSDEQIALGLANLRQSTETTLNFSYFITQEMRAKLEQSEFQGVLPILLAFAARAGAHVEEIATVRIDSEGHLRDTGVGGTMGWRLILSQPGQARPRTVFYFRGDLSNSGLRGPSAGLLRWLKNQPRGSSYLKAASYLLHENHFSQARDFLLSQSDILLQDDSGIPLRFFSPRDWQLYFFGTYTRPIELFQNRHQPDLQLAYETAPPRPLPFGTGYMFRAGESNLMLAVRRGLAPAIPSPTSPTSPTSPSLPHSPLPPSTSATEHPAALRSVPSVPILRALPIESDFPSLSPSSPAMPSGPHATPLAKPGEASPEIPSDEKPVPTSRPFTGKPAIFTPPATPLE